MQYSLIYKTQDTTALTNIIVSCMYVKGHNNCLGAHNLFSLRSRVQNLVIEYVCSLRTHESLTQIDARTAYIHMIDAAQLTAILSYIMDYHRGWDI